MWENRRNNMGDNMESTIYGVIKRQQLSTHYYKIVPCQTCKDQWAPYIWSEDFSYLGYEIGKLKKISTSKTFALW